MDPGLEEGVSTAALLVLACLIGVVSGVVSALLGEKAIRASERTRMEKR